MVQDNLRRNVREGGALDGCTDEPWAWTSERVGTVHVAQGREAEGVVLVLGAQDPKQTDARGWAGGRPNLLSVAVNRAKVALYVVGNRRLWREAGGSASWAPACRGVEISPLGLPALSTSVPAPGLP